MTAPLRPATSTRDRQRPRGGVGDLLARPLALSTALGVLYLPFTLLGYGTDIDVANVLRAGESILGGDYQLSRPPGAVPHEAATAVLDRLGGSVLVNLASVAFAVLALAMVGRLLASEGVARPGWGVLVLGANPWFWMAATSLGDFTWALGLALAGAERARSGHRVTAGALFGLAIGTRASTVLLAAAWLAAERLGERSTRVGWQQVLTTGAVAAAVGVAWFVPPWLAVGRSLRFLDNELAFAGLFVHAGRWAVKNVAAVGVVGALVLAVGAPVLAAAVRRWPTSQVVRFAVLGAVAGQVLFLRFPWKIVHLLPVLACLALLAARSPRAGTAGGARWLGALVASQVLLAVVSVTVAAPDVPDAATTGRVEVGVVKGVLVNDVACRLEDRDDGPWPDVDSEAAVERATERYECQSRSWRASSAR